MGKRDVSRIRTTALRLSGHAAAGPSGVVGPVEAFDKPWHLLRGGRFKVGCVGAIAWV